MSTCHQLSLIAVYFFSSFSQIFSKLSYSVRDYHLLRQGLPGVRHSQITEQCNCGFSAFLRLLVILNHLGCPKFIWFTVNEIPSRTQNAHPLHSWSSVMTIGFCLQKFLQSIGCSPTYWKGSQRVLEHSPLVCHTQYFVYWTIYIPPKIYC